MLMLHINVVGISSIDWIITMKLRNEYKKVRNVYRQKDEGRITDEDWKRAGQEVEKFKRSKAALSAALKAVAGMVFSAF